MYRDYQRTDTSTPRSPTGDSATSDMSKARLLSSRSSSAPSSPISRDSDIEEKNYGLLPRPQVHGRRLRSVLSLVFAVLFVIVVILAVVIAALVRKRGSGGASGGETLNDHPADKDTQTFVNVSCGTVVGTVQDHVHVFKGIPYAKAPVGRLRWMPTEPLNRTNGQTCWGPDSDTWTAEDFGSQCSQYSAADQQWVGSEDCLYLNVWSPQTSKGASLLPVMVYFHGGGLMTGSGHQPGLSPSPSLAKAANMVFVSFNYRLNVFGFLALDLLSWSSRNGTSGNYGILDQLQALRWVQDNIASFGGDPKKVTVFGVDSGATSIYALLACPTARGLFHRAWLASPSPKVLHTSTLAIAQIQNEDYYNATGCKVLNSPQASLDCLQSLSAERVTSVLDWEAWSNPHFRDLPTPGETSTILLVTSGNAIKDYPINAWKTKNFIDIPLLIGNMAQEVDVSPLPVDIASWDWSTYENYITEKLQHFPDKEMVFQALTHYGRKVSAEYQFTSMVSDIRYIQPMTAISTVVANVSESPVYRYVSSYTAQNPIGKHTSQKNYAFTGMDMLAFFGSLHNISTSPEEMKNYSDTIQKTVFGFARNGHIPRWNSFPQSTVVLTSQHESNQSMCVVKSLGYFYKREEYDFWRLHGLFPTFAAMN